MLDMKQKKIYIQAAEQISIQQPLSQEWMDEPLFYDASLIQSINPAFRDYIAPNEARRMGSIMKRALVTSLKVLRDTGIEHPDAVITGTSFGSLVYTEKFLDALVENGEQALSPTYFMQSTHNTVSSALSIYTKTHGYNTTYSHGRNSFELALQDAWMQMQLGKISNALVGGHDEMTEWHYYLLKKTNYVGFEGMCPCSEVAMSMVLNTEAHENDLCELVGMSISYEPTADTFSHQVEKLLGQAGISLPDVSAVMTGVNGNPLNDNPYNVVMGSLFAGKPYLRYKHLFGENHTSSSLGLYAAAHCLGKQRVPDFMQDERGSKVCHTLENILFVNLVDGRDCSLILLKKK